MKMQTLNMILSLSLSTAFSGALGCSVKATEVKAQEVATGGVGPYEVTKPIDAAAGFENHFQINVAQSEGKVEYFITQAEDVTLVLTESKAQVTACAGDKVQITHYWIQDTAKGYAVAVSKGGKFQVKAQVKGVLLVAFRGLGDCSTLSYNMSIKKYVQAMTPVADFTRSKSVLCKHANGTEFMMNYPHLSFGTDGNGFPNFKAGTVCYGEKRPGALNFSFTKFYQQDQANYIIGPNYALQLFTSSGPVAYMEYGYYPTTSSPQMGRGRMGTWYPTNLDLRAHDMTCEFYRETFEQCI